MTTLSTTAPKKMQENQLLENLLGVIAVFLKLLQDRIVLNHVYSLVLELDRKKF